MHKSASQPSQGPARVNIVLGNFLDSLEYLSHPTLMNIDDQNSPLGADAFPGGFTRRDEANAIVAYAFRNGPIEGLHAGKYSKLLEDPSLSRITDKEMKTLMIAACRRMEELLRLRDSDPDEYARHVRSYNLQYCPGWER